VKRHVLSRVHSPAWSVSDQCTSHIAGEWKSTKFSRSMQLMTLRIGVRRLCFQEHVPVHLQCLMHTRGHAAATATASPQCFASCHQSQGSIDPCHEHACDTAPGVYKSMHLVQIEQELS
jgi:hypothetical protein